MDDNILTLDNEYQEDVDLEGELYAVGERGYSAYEIAVQNGFIGTEEEWLESLVGPQGGPGYSPSASVTKSGDTATITITDEQGTTTATVSDGQDGEGVPTGGTAGQILSKVDSTDYNTEWVNAPDISNMVTTDTTQNISGKKTFTTNLPESSIVPSNNNQLINKKYVDDSIKASTICLGNISKYNGVLKALNLDTLEEGKTYLLINDIGDSDYFYVRVTSETYGLIYGYLQISYNKVQMPYLCLERKNFLDDLERLCYGVLYGHVVNLTNSQIYTYDYLIRENQDNTLSFSSIGGYISVVTTNEVQTISGKKTFTTLPESSVVPTTDNQLVNKKYVDDNGGQAIQYDTVPTASEDTVGEIIQYIGTTDANYTHGYFYECVSDGEDPATYSWSALSVQEGLQTQYSTMPTPSAELVGKVVQYIGATDSNYTNGYFYVCVNNGGVYSWQQVDVQPGGEIDPELEEKVERNSLYENALITEKSSGTELILDNTVKCPINIILAPSELSQEGTPTPDYPQDIHTVTGDNTIILSDDNKNLIHIKNITAPAGITVTEVNDTEIILNGTASANGEVILDLLSITMAGTKTYASSVNMSGSYSAPNDEIWLEIENSSSLNLVMDSVSRFTATGQEQSDVNVGQLSVGFNSNTTFTNLHLQLQLEQNSYATEYVPHQEQILPVTLGTLEYCKIGNYADEFMIPNKNLLNNDLNLTLNGRWGYPLNNLIVGETYSFAGWLKPGESGAASIRIGINVEGTMTSITENISTTPQSFIVEENKDYYIFLAGTTSQSNALTAFGKYDIEFEKGNSIEGYEPYNNGKWYLKKNIGEVVLDGSESDWNNGGTDGNTTYRTYLTKSDVALNTNDEIKAISNYFAKNTPSNSVDNQIVGISTRRGTGHGLYIRVPIAIASTIAEFKTWLETALPTVYYVLATPEYTLLNDTLQEQLTNIYNKALSYQDQTNISQVNDDLPFIINASAIQNTENYINSMSNQKVPTYTLNLTTKVTNGANVLNDTDKSALNNIFTDAYAKNYEQINILINMDINYTTKKMQVLLMSSGKGVQSILTKPTQYTFEYFANYTGYVGNVGNMTKYEMIFGWLYISTMSWSGDTCSISSCNINCGPNYIPTINGVLAKDNTASYTPTANYHPATKKYVDDSIASAITDALGGNY